MERDRGRPRTGWWGIAFSLLVFFQPPLCAQDLALLRRPPERAAVSKLQELRERFAEPVHARWNPLTGRIRSLSGRFVLPAGLGLEEAALRFVRSQRDLLGWSPSLELRLLHERRGIDSRHLRYRAHLNGVPLSSGEVAVHVDVSPGDGGPPEIIYLTSSLPPPEGLSAVSPALGFPPPRIDERRAVRIAEDAVSRAVRRSSTARLEVFSLRPPARLAYAVRVSSSKPLGLFTVWVDAGTGEILLSGDLLRYGLGKTRDGAGKVFRVSPVVALRNPDLEDLDDSAAAVPKEAYSDVILPQLDGTGVLSGPYVTTSRTPNAVRRVRLEFPFLRDVDAFEEVMIYYHVDSTQRFIQSLGFDDIYNRQITAYANAQPPGIPYTEAQAFFEPSFDVPGTGEMAFGSGRVDFAEDPEVIVHEYGHAVQLNQVPTLGAVFESVETFSIEEGWADFFGASYLSAFSGGHGDVCLGEWARRGAPLFPGDDKSPCFRRLDSDKHYPEDLVGSPHADGEMWSSSLWLAHELLGRDQVLRLVLQSHFFLPENARFRDAVESVLEADRQLNAGAHEDFLTGVFGDRGFLLPPPDATWFYVLRPAGDAGRIPPFDPRVFKFRLERAGNVALDDRDAIEVYVDAAHPLPFLLDLVLRSPSGTEVVLHRGGFSELPPGPVIFDRSFPADESLAVLAGEPVSGVWTLQVTNLDFVADAVLAEWGLRFRGFLRGDADRNGRVDIEDPIAALEYLFARGGVPCLKAADFNDDGALNVSDAVGWLFFFYLGGSPPPEPYPQAGEDLTEDSLTCDA